MTGPLSSNKRSDTLLSISTAAVFVVVALVLNLEYALEAAVTFGVFSAIIQYKWFLKKQIWFWIIIAIFLTIHLVLAIIVRIPDMRPGIIAVPIAVIDGLCMLAVITWIQRRKTTGTR